MIVQSSEYKLYMTSEFLLNSKIINVTHLLMNEYRIHAGHFLDGTRCGGLRQHVTSTAVVLGRFLNWKKDGFYRRVSYLKVSSIVWFWREIHNGGTNILIKFNILHHLCIILHGSKGVIFKNFNRSTQHFVFKKCYFFQAFKPYNLLIV